MSFTVAPGRRLRWSPRWPGEDTSVLFDGASGDFWVLDHEARELLEQLASRSAAAATTSGGVDDAAVLQALLEAELIMQTPAGGASLSD